jgi:hypothetical protein
MHLSSMRFLLAALSVVALIYPATASTSYEQISKDQATECKTKECHARVAQKKKAKLRKSCKSITCKRRVGRKQRIKAWTAFIAPYRGWLAQVRACESPTGRDSSNGMYHGFYQFDWSSWAGAGGTGDPHHASFLEQSYRAVIWLKRAGRGAWPNCG